MHATFYSLEWKKSGDAEFITRKPNEEKPTGTCKVYKHNEDGSVVYMITKKGQYILTLQTADGKFVYEDIYGIIKYYKYNVRITKNFRERFEAFMRTREFSVDDDTGFIRGLYGDNGIQAFFTSNP